MSIKNFQHFGFCPICEKETTFTSEYDWFRDHLKCKYCNSVPRERTLMYVLDKIFPNRSYEDKLIHESSPTYRGVSVKLRNLSNYSFSHFFPEKKTGSYVKGIRNENIEDMTFESESFDIFVTQDVLEHVYHPDKAFREIARVLKSSGIHIFTVPLVNKFTKTEARINFDEEKQIIYKKEKLYHGNPISDKGSLVTFDWGYDIVDFIYKHSGMRSIIYSLDYIDYGIRAEYNEVIVSTK